MSTEKPHILYVEAHPHTAVSTHLQTYARVTHIAPHTAVTNWPPHHDLILIHQPLLANATADLWQTLQRYTTLLLIPAGQEAQAAHAIQQGLSHFLVQDEQAGYLNLLPSLIERAIVCKQAEKERQQMLTAVQERNQVLALLSDINSELSTIFDVDEVVEQLMSTTIKVLGAQGCSIWLWEDGLQTHLVCQAVTDLVVKPPLEGVRVSVSDGVVGWVARHGRSTIVSQTNDDIRFLANIDVKINFQTQSLMAVPMRLRDSLIGVLEIVNKMEGDFNQDDLVVTQTLATSAASAIENARLVEALRHRTADLEERNNELDAFAHTVAHDIQNMLARILGFAELLRLDLNNDALFQPDAPTEDMRQAAAYIASNSRKMSNVVEALLLLSSARGAEVEQDPLYNMGGIVASVVERLSNIIEQEKADIHLPPTWPQALGFAPWVEEIWYNYISNALRHGGSPPHITIGAETDEAQATAVFWVQDNGAGIAPANQPLLFTPFSQIGRKRSHGHGLGLSIVERLAKRMGGNVAVESEVGQGSRFIFSLPLSTPEAEPPHS